jgi:hypothetical protein
MLANPSWRCNPTKKHPLYCARGDLVEIDGRQEEVISAHATLWLENGDWSGSGLLAEPSQEALNYIPPHIQLINWIIGPNLKQGDRQ